MDDKQFRRVYRGRQAFSGPLIIYGFALIVMIPAYKAFFGPYCEYSRFGPAIVRSVPAAVGVLLAWGMLDLIFCRCPVCRRYIGFLRFVLYARGNLKKCSDAGNACEAERRVLKGGYL
jgi:hypothetical protein